MKIEIPVNRWRNIVVEHEGNVYAIVEYNQTPIYKAKETLINYIKNKTSEGNNYANL